MGKLRIYVADTEGGRDLKTNPIREATFILIAEFDTQKKELQIAVEVHNWNLNQPKTFKEFLADVLSCADISVVLTWNGRRHDKHVFDRYMPSELKNKVIHGDPLLWARRDFDGVAPFPKQKQIDNFIVHYNLEKGIRHSAFYDTKILYQVLLIMIMLDSDYDPKKYEESLESIRRFNNVYIHKLIHTFVFEPLIYGRGLPMTRLQRLLHLSSENLPSEFKVFADNSHHLTRSISKIQPAISILPFNSLQHKSLQELRSIIRTNNLSVSPGIGGRNRRTKEEMAKEILQELSRRTVPMGK